MKKQKQQREQRQRVIILGSVSSMCLCLCRWIGECCVLLSFAQFGTTGMVYIPILPASSFQVGSVLGTSTSQCQFIRVVHNFKCSVNMQEVVCSRVSSTFQFLPFSYITINIFDDISQKLQGHLHWILDLDKTKRSSLSYRSNLLSPIIQKLLPIQQEEYLGLSVLLELVCSDSSPQSSAQGQRPLLPIGLGSCLHCVTVATAGNVSIHVFAPSSGHAALTILIQTRNRIGPLEHKPIV